MKKMALIVLIIGLFVLLGFIISNQKREWSEQIDRIDRGIIGTTKTDVEESFKNQSR